MASLKKLFNFPCVLFVGVPGSGKTTFASAISHYANTKLNVNVFSNTPINHTYQVTKDDIGSSLMRDGILIFDEAGCDLNGRGWKSMSQDTIKYLKYIRHFNMRSFWFSQDLDMDATIRRLASVIFIVRRSRIPFFISAVPVRCKFAVDDTSHELTKKYFVDPPLFAIFSTVRIFAPKYWGLFDSWSTYPLNSKSFELCEFEPRKKNFSLHPFLKCKALIYDCFSKRIARRETSPAKVE